MIQFAKRHVLLLYKKLNPSARLCGHCQLEELAARGEIDYRHAAAARVSKKDIDWAEIVLMSRLDNPYEYGLAKQMKKAGKTLVYVIDDDLLNVPEGLSSTAYYRMPQTQRSIRGMMEASEAIVSPSRVLLSKYAVDGRKGIWLEEPAIEPVPYKPHQPGRPVRIGFAGSIDRAGDIEEILKNTLLQIKQEYAAKVEFVFFGARPDFIEELQGEYVPYCDSYEAYREKLNGLELDIGLAPMPGTAFHGCKHYNKFIEYAAAGIAGVFSDVRPYDQLKERFGWELVCANTTEAWYALLKGLLEDPEKLERLKVKAVQLVCDEFDLQRIAEQFGNRLNELPLQTAHCPINGIRLWAMQRVNDLAAIVQGLMRHGLKAPLVIIQKLRKQPGF